jgi:hypothetical protein
MVVFPFGTTKVWKVPSAYFSACSILNTCRGLFRTCFPRGFPFLCVRFILTISLGLLHLLCWLLNLYLTSQGFFLSCHCICDSPCNFTPSICGYSCFISSYRSSPTMIFSFQSWLVHSGDPSCHFSWWGIV